MQLRCASQRMMLLIVYTDQRAVRIVHTYKQPRLGHDTIMMLSLQKV
jgi:hypothetical protein